MNLTERLIRILDEIDAKIKYIENSPNRAFVLIEYETISPFHSFNMCFKWYWNRFDHCSANQLFKYMEILKRFSEMCDKYENMLKEQRDFWGSKINYQNKCVDIFPPVIFSEESKKDYFEYYQGYFEAMYDGYLRPIYEIGLTTKDSYQRRYERISDEGIYYELRCDKLYDLHYKAILNTYYCLDTLISLISIVRYYPKTINAFYMPSQEEIINALEAELCKYAKEKGMTVERDLQKTAQLLKPSRNEMLNSIIWGNVMKEEDDLYDLAISNQLEDNKEKRFEFVNEEQRKRLTDNALLLEKIKSNAFDGELFDIRLSVENNNLHSSLNADNLDLFYELILRRNIIQREMFPDKMKDEYDKWVNSSEEQQPDDGKENGLSEARQSKLDEIIEILKNGNWKQPATPDNIELLMNAVFGKDTSLLEDDDIAKCEDMWSFVEGGGGERMLVVPANLAGFLAEENLLAGTPKVISNDLFGNGNNVNNINKGNSKHCSKFFNGIRPFLKKYTDKIIRQI